MADIQSMLCDHVPDEWPQPASEPDVDVPHSLVTPEVYGQLVDRMLGHFVEATRPVRGGVAFRVEPPVG